MAQPAIKDRETPLPEEAKWYLIRTKPGKERWVCDQLRGTVTEVFLPFLKARVPRWGKPAWSIVPLFPCYLFARFDLGALYYDIRYMAGVSGLVSAGGEPLVAPESIIAQIKQRGLNGIIEIAEPRLNAGERVVVLDGPFKGFEAMFERYLSSEERVAILLNAVEASGIRVILTGSVVARAKR